MKKNWFLLIPFFSFLTIACTSNVSGLDDYNIGSKASNKTNQTNFKTSLEKINTTPLDVKAFFNLTLLPKDNKEAVDTLVTNINKDLGNFSKMPSKITTNNFSSWYVVSTALDKYFKNTNKAFFYYLLYEAKASKNALNNKQLDLMIRITNTALDDKNINYQKTMTFSFLVN